jgi:hypothetical protein
VNELLLASLPLLQSSGSDDSGSLFVLLAGPVVGAALYGAIYRYYRNADKSDQFERETRIELKTQITGNDQKVDAIKGTRKRRIDGDNSSAFRSRVTRLE